MLFDTAIAGLTLLFNAVHLSLEKVRQIPLSRLCVTGTYKPRIRCYDAYQLSLKFERCLDSDGKSYDHNFASVV